MAYTTEALVEGEILQSIDTTTEPTTAQLSCWIAEVDAEIDELSGTKFACTTVTSSIIPFTSSNAFNDSVQTYWYGRVRQQTNNVYNAVFLQDINGGPQRRPIISVTDLCINTAGVTETDSWSALTENTGTGGSYVVDKETGRLTFLQCVPIFGHPRAIKTTFVYGTTATPATVQQLSTKMVARRVIAAKANTSQFRTIDNISLEGTAVNKAISQTAAYLGKLDQEIERLKAQVVGTLRVDVAR